MVKSEKMVKAINTLNLRHRRGWLPSKAIGKIPTGEHFMNEADELVEALDDLRAAPKEHHENKIVLPWSQPLYPYEQAKEHVLEEIGDVFGTLMQLCYNLGFTFEQIDEKAVEKMRMRFDNGDKVDLSEYGD